MIEVERLTKRFGSTLAVDDLSFSVAPGTITGPRAERRGEVDDHAGDPRPGPADVGQYDGARPPVPRAGNAVAACRRVARDLRRASRPIGPKSPPCARGRRRHPAIARRRRACARRSGTAGKRRVKGYSLACDSVWVSPAALGDPEVLVLDEPANGLDPQGIRWFVTSFALLASEGRRSSSRATSSPRSRRPWTSSSSIGKLVRHVAIAEVEAPRRPTTVRSPDADRLLELLRSAGSTLGASVRDVSR